MRLLRDGSQSPRSKVIWRPTNPICSLPASARFFGLEFASVEFSIGIENLAVRFALPSVMFSRKARLRASNGMVNWILDCVGSSIVTGGPSICIH